jgi:hypothetical protein
VESLEKVSPILILPLLVLLNGGDVFSHLCLPLGVLVKLVPNVLLCLFNSRQLGVEAGALYLLRMITHGLVMVTISKE